MAALLIAVTVFVFYVVGFVVGTLLTILNSGGYGLVAVRAVRYA